MKILNKQDNIDYSSYTIEDNNNIYSVIKPCAGTWVAFAGVKLSVRDSEGNIVRDKNIIENINNLIFQKRN